jgi:hypothetical protein
VKDNTKFSSVVFNFLTIFLKIVNVKQKSLNSLYTGFLVNYSMMHFHMELLKRMLYIVCVQNSKGVSLFKICYYTQACAKMTQSI